jgi:hypothetical protein
LIGNGGKLDKRIECRMLIVAPSQGGKPTQVQSREQQ